MNILFVTLFALETNTSVTKSNYGIIKGLIKLGHNVTLLMPEIDQGLSYYDNSLDLNGITIERIKNENVGQQIANRSASAQGMKKKIMSAVRYVYSKCRVFDRTKELLSEAKNFTKYNQYFDIVISTSDPKTSHLFVKEMIKNGLKYGKWIQHWGDPLVGDISRNNIYPNFYMEYIESNIISKAERIIYVSPFTLESQQKRYPTQNDKMVFVPLPCDEKSHIEEKKKIKMGDGRKTIVYLGDYASSIRNIMPLYNACAELEFVNLVIAGNSDLELEEKDNIKILGRISQVEVKKLENEADIIVSVGNLSGTQIPGKIYYVASTNKIILVTIDGNNKFEMKKYLESYNRFVCCENTQKEIKGAIRRLCESEKITYETPEQLKPVNIAKQILC